MERARADLPLLLLVSLLDWTLVSLTNLVKKKVSLPDGHGVKICRWDEKQEIKFVMETGQCSSSPSSGSLLRSPPRPIES